VQIGNNSDSCVIDVSLFPTRDVGSAEACRVLLARAKNTDTSSKTNVNYAAPSIDWRTFGIHIMLVYIIGVFY